MMKRSAATSVESDSRVAEVTPFARNARLVALVGFVMAKVRSARAFCATAGSLPRFESVRGTCMLRMIVEYQIRFDSE